jgi:DNA-binding NtrC family response regulator
VARQITFQGFTPDQVRLAAARVLEHQRLKRRLLELEEQLDESGDPLQFESESPAFRRFLQMAARAAASDAVVLLRGESGTARTSSPGGFDRTVHEPGRRSRASIARRCRAI